MVRAKLRQETAYWQVSMSEKQYHTQLNGCLYKYCGLLSLFYSHIISYPRTGFPGHSDQAAVDHKLYLRFVSIPNGLPRPFRLGTVVTNPNAAFWFQSRTGFPGHSDIFYCIAVGPGGSSFNPERASQAIPTLLLNQNARWHSDVSIPNGLPRPFRLGWSIQCCALALCVSIPNGLPRPFRRQIFLVQPHCPSGFNPERASQAIPTAQRKLRTRAWVSVSIPNGLPRPFRRRSQGASTSKSAMFQSRTGFPGHSDIQQ